MFHVLSMPPERLDRPLAKSTDPARSRGLCPNPRNVCTSTGFSVTGRICSIPRKLTVGRLSGKEVRNCYLPARLRARDQQGLLAPIPSRNIFRIGGLRRWRSISLWHECALAGPLIVLGLAASESPARNAPRLPHLAPESN